MHTAQPGDRVLVHYVKRFQGGEVVSSPVNTPLELTVGQEHPRLPGLGLALVGLAPGETTTLTVPAERAYGQPRPDRIFRLYRKRFPPNANLQIGESVYVWNSRGRRRLVRIVEVHTNMVLVDANHRWAGQRMELKVHLHRIGCAETDLAGSGREDPGSQRPRAILFDVDANSQSSLRQALSGWEIETIHGATSSSLARDWNPAKAHLLVVGSREDRTEMLGLCRFLVFCSTCPEDSRLDMGPSGSWRDLRSEVGNANAPLLVLVQPAQESLVQEVLRTGAHSCLVLPIHHKQVTSMLACLATDKQPGRHTLNLQQPQGEDLWRDDGGEG